MSITLSKTETRILTEAAGRGGALQLLETMKPITRQRMLGRFEAEGLITVGGKDGTDPHLTPAGYRALGLPVPRKAKATTSPTGSKDGWACSRPATKSALITAMLARDEGASLDELIAATGWLPHTTRAALSRLRSSGQVLAKSKREDGRTAYRIETGMAA